MLLSLTFLMILISLMLLDVSALTLVTFKSMYSSRSCSSKLFQHKPFKTFSPAPYSSRENRNFREDRSNGQKQYRDVKQLDEKFRRPTQDKKSAIDSTRPFERDYRPSSPKYGLNYAGRRFDNRYGEEKPPKDDFEGDYLYGISPVLLALKAQKRKFYELILQEDMDISNKKDEKGAQEILDLVTSLNINRKEMTKHDMNMLTDSRPHQGFILKSSSIEFEKIVSLPPSTEYKCVLALDEVWDPQNFGALIRTSHFLHVDQVVICAKNSAPPSPTVSKASAGALEVTPVYSTQNLMKFLDQSIANGWQVVGTSLTKDTITLNELPLDKPTIIVLGNEGHGIRTNILNRCNYLVRIGDSTATDVDSLNVSVSGGIILHHLMQRAK